MDHWDDVFKPNNPWDDDYDNDDDDDLYDDDDPSDVWDDNDDDAEFIEGERSESERWDIPDLPDPNLLSDALSNRERAIQDALYGAFSEEKDPDVPVESIFEVSDHERIDGISRSLLSLSRHGFASYGSALCQYLAEDLKRYSDKLLFGLIDGLYLHSTRSMTYVTDRICVNLRVFWDPAPSPYPLLADQEALEGNPGFIYLLIGDLLEDLINGIEKATREADGNGGDAS